MPRGDGTGPMGSGPMTGRRAGYCAGFDAPGCMNPGPRWGRGYGRGYGPGLGRGRGWGVWGYRGRGFWRPGVAAASPEGSAYAGPWGVRQVTREEELDYLRAQAGMLKNELDEITARVRDMEGESSGGER